MLFPIGASRKLHLGKYFALKTLATRDSGWVRILQPCFANKASLNTNVSLKLSPPFSLFLQIFFQFTQWIFLLSKLLPHQKLHAMLSNWWHKPLGTWKQLIMYVGKA
jgi:hypothetical protein